MVSTFFACFLTMNAVLPVSWGGPSMTQRVYETHPHRDPANVLCVAKKTLGSHPFVI